MLMWGGVEQCIIKTCNQCCLPLWSHVLMWGGVEQCVIKTCNHSGKQHVLPSTGPLPGGQAGGCEQTVF